MDVIRDLERYVRSELACFDGRITTITCFASLNRYIDYMKLISVKWKNDVVGVRIPGSQKNKRRLHYSFSNSVSLSAKKKGRQITCKVFSNGFHLTGCNSWTGEIGVEECIHEVFLPVVKDICYGDGDGRNVIVQDYKLQLMNIMIDVGTELDLDELSRKIKRSFYDVERYSGLRVKEDGCGTILAFRSGKVMFTGVKNVENLEKMLAIVRQEFL